MIADHDRCYRILCSRDPRFDGWFVVAVRTTGIYCRPSCPARTPKPSNVTFHPTAAAAQLAGYRACKRCRPDASPGSPAWSQRSDTVARAMRLLAEGVVDRHGVGGLAERLGYSERHLHRILVAELGAGPLALARAQRAQNARVLVETTSMPMVDVAFAAGFSSLRQFNDTMRQVFDATPRSLRRAAVDRDGPDDGVPGTISLRLAVRRPFAAEHLWSFLAHRALAGVETATEHSYERWLRLPHGVGRVTLRPAGDHVAATMRLADVRDLTAAVARCRRLLDLDADPVAVDAHLGGDVALAPLVAATPGLRSPGAVDGFEMAVRAVVGQQVSLAGGLRAAERLAAGLGEVVGVGADDDAPERFFPTPAAVAEVDPDSLPMPRRRAAALVAVAAEVAAGRVDLDPAADRAEVRRRLLAISGIGPWTADYVAMRAFGDPDVWLGGDLVLRRTAERLGIAAASLPERSLRWTPWRTTVVHHLWSATSHPPTVPGHAAETTRSTT